MGYCARLTFPAIFAESLNKFKEADAMCFVGETPMKYKEVNDKIQALIAFLEETGVKPGDKVAILSSNMPNCGIAYFAITFMGATTVPLLPDFHPNEIKNILNHSESKAIFVSKNLIHKLKDFSSETLESIINIEDFSFSNNSSIVFNINNKPKEKYDVKEENLAAIIYTSGTTGKSKGVMLTHKNICFDTIMCKKIQPVYKTDRFLSILPLSHTYENTLGLILPLFSGACIYYLKKPPVASVLLPALKKVKPTVMLSVPLIIEKIYRSKIKPAFEKNIATKVLYNIPIIRKRLNYIAGKKLLQTFGGELKFFGVGGAKLDRTVEQFLIEAKFPYAIGYGLTETSPLIAGTAPFETKLQAVGPCPDGIQMKIYNPDPKTGEGEVWAKGDNVMQGYYKDPKQTKEVLTADGWFKTGDLGIIDKNNYLTIKGRIKNVIVEASGENIYPEEIEAVINNYKHVVESLVVQQKGKLVALVHFDIDELEKKYKNFKDEVSNYVEGHIDELIQELTIYVNKNVNKYSQLQLVIAQPTPFQKTATHKIKRFLYT